MTAATSFLALASLMGAAGVALLAAGAHGAASGGGGLLTTAGQILLFHASTVIGATSARRQGLIAARMGALALATLLAGATVFSADLATRELVGARLFPMAAPVGGTILIFGWAGLFAAAILARRGTDKASNGSLP